MCEAHVPTCHNVRNVEVSLVRRRVKSTIDAARNRAQQRRQENAAAEQAYQAFLQNIAVPVTRMVASALKAESYAFTVFTPGGGLRLDSDRGRDDYIEFALDTAAAHPQVIGRISRTRGSRTMSEERPVRDGASPEQLTEEDVLAFLLETLDRWLER